MKAVEINDIEFMRIQNLMQNIAGIKLAESKKILVVSRLSKRVRALGLNSFGQYFDKIESRDSDAELQVAIDLLTTNETYFFREPKHFELLKNIVEERKNRSTPLDVWSAASSSGQEAYTIAMVLSECMGPNGWKILGTDISTSVIEKANQGLYPIAQAHNIEIDLLKKYCLKGVESQDGMFLIDKIIKKNITFQYANLMENLSSLGSFDVIFLRNVMIYFDLPTKSKLIQRLLNNLKPGGYLFIGHSESLNGVSDRLTPVTSSLYRKQ